MFTCRPLALGDLEVKRIQKLLLRLTRCFVIKALYSSDRGTTRIIGVGASV
jgi:hypothetical protein